MYVVFKIIVHDIDQQELETRQKYHASVGPDVVIFTNIAHIIFTNIMVQDIDQQELETRQKYQASVGPAVVQQKTADYMRSVTNQHTVMYI